MEKGWTRWEARGSRPWRGGHEEWGLCQAPPHLLVLILLGVVFLQPVCQGPVFEGARHAVLHLDFA